MQTFFIKMPLSSVFCRVPRKFARRYHRRFSLSTGRPSINTIDTNQLLPYGSDSIHMCRGLTRSAFAIDERAISSRTECVWRIPAAGGRVSRVDLQRRIDKIPGREEPVSSLCLIGVPVGESHRNCSQVKRTR